MKPARLSQNELSGRPRAWETLPALEPGNKLGPSAVVETIDRRAKAAVYGTLQSVKPNHRFALLWWADVGDASGNEM